ncbi:acyltransferase [Thermopolyspora sp. NPDC052614]|uniref:acyltransferase family protein n=1 Tax=Thermopolyspora sp. NPDC052614 TaxID=3155682 RepID=UPI00342F9796
MRFPRRVHRAARPNATQPAARAASTFAGGEARHRARLACLDGIRGVAALFVMVHHCWLLSFPGYPRDTGPGWAGWLLYGHFAVVVFIVLSGFSLAVSPARSGWRLGGLGRFAQRRAWRILPPYWAALALSLVIAWTVIPQPGEGPPTAKSVLVYGLLTQDLFGAPSPNGAFWSIAIEAQLYLAFPAMLLVLARYGAAVMLGAVTAIVVAVGALAPYVPAVDLLMRLTPQFAALFAAGVVATVVLAADRPSPNRLDADRMSDVAAGHPGPSDLGQNPIAPGPATLARDAAEPAGRAGRPKRYHALLPWLALATAVPAVTLIVVQGSVWTVENFFWVDLALGPCVALLLAALATGRPAWLVRLLDLRPLRRLGSFSYSLYLTHAPFVVIMAQLIVAPRVTPGVPAFLTTLALSAPLTIAVAWAFAAVFELPFQRHRSWTALRAAIRARLPRRKARPAANEP